MAVSDVVEPRFATQAAGRRFHTLCRSVVEDGMDESVYLGWKAAHERRVYVLKPRSTPEIRAKILSSESKTWEALQYELPQGSRVEATVTQNLEVSLDTNERMQRIEAEQQKQSGLLAAIANDTAATRAVAVDCKVPAQAPGQTSASRKLQLQSTVRGAHTQIKQIDIFNKGVTSPELFQYTICNKGATMEVTGLPANSTVAHLKVALALQDADFFDDMREVMRFTG